MPGLNRIIATGRLTKDPELRYTKEEVPVARFVVEVNAAKSSDPQTFVCVARRGLATIVAEYLKKGSLVAIEGKMQTKTYKSKGKDKMAAYISVDNMLMLDTKFYKSTVKSEAEA